MSAASSTPSIAELRAATQPQSIFERNSGEHWAGRLYMRSVSPYVTRLLMRTPITPNGVTWLMIVVGLLAAAAGNTAKAREIFLERFMICVVRIFFDNGDDFVARDKPREIVDVTVGVVAFNSVTEPKNLLNAKKITKPRFDFLARKLGIPILI